MERHYKTMGRVLTLLVAMDEELAPNGRTVYSLSNDRMVATIDTQGLTYLGLLALSTVSVLLIAFLYICKAPKDSRGRMVKVKPEAKYVIDLVANDILANEDYGASVASDFGIALSSLGPSRYQICIDREGVAYKGGIVRGGSKHDYTHIHSRKRIRVCS